MHSVLNPTVYTWNCILYALVKVDEINEALVYASRMKDLKCSTIVVTYCILINGLCRVRKFNKAFVF